MTEIDRKESNICVRCNGEGKIECSTCHGRGGRHARRYGPTDFSYRSFKSRFEWESCTNCDGSGRQTCPECLGEGGAFALSEEPVVPNESRVEDKLKLIVEMLRSPSKYDIPNEDKAERWAYRLEQLSPGFFDEVKVIEEVRLEVDSELNDLYGAYPKPERQYLILLSTELASLRSDFKRQR